MIGHACTREFAGCPRRTYTQLRVRVRVRVRAYARAYRVVLERSLFPDRLKRAIDVSARHRRSMPRCHF